MCLKMLRSSVVDWYKRCAGVDRGRGRGHEGLPIEEEDVRVAVGLGECLEVWRAAVVVDVA